MDWLRRHYLSVDPRTLGVFRIALASLLLVDLVKRTLGIEYWYVDSGLMPGHTALWRPSRAWQFSLHWGATRPEEVMVAFGLSALVYLALLVGYRTRVAQVLALVSIVSLQSRVDMLSNGGDFVLCVVSWWTVFLPLGRRYSVDSVLASLRSRVEHDEVGLAETAALPRDSSPVVSLAVLAFTLQLAIIYVFNTLHKSGGTWMRGEAVHWVMQQERILSWIGLAAREHLTPGIAKVLTYGTLVAEGSLPVLILSPVGKPWTRRLAILTVAALHLGIAIVLNFGIFSPAMVVFSLLLLSPQDFDAIGGWLRRRARPIVVHFDADCGVCFAAMRLLVRLDLHGAIRFVPIRAGNELPDGFDASELERTILVIEGGKDRHYTRSAALARIVAALPLGWSVAWFMRLPGIRWLLDQAYDAFAARRTAISVSVGLAACGLPGAGGHGATEVAPAPTAARRGWRRLLAHFRETAVLALIAIAVVQVLVENWALPKSVRVKRPPEVVRAVVSYTRMQQGWSMFSADAPITEVYVVIDAVTEDGRHVDPLNEVAGREADPLLRRVPVRPGYDVFWVDYVMRIPHRGEYHGPLQSWIFAYHERTGRAEDRIVRFDAYLIEQDSPPPGEREPRNFRHRRFFSGRR
jgi:predicted DCC family thiol-disulfide oxidoreductase YuxK